MDRRPFLFVTATLVCSAGCATSKGPARVTTAPTESAKAPEKTEPAPSAVESTRDNYFDFVTILRQEKHASYDEQGKLTLREVFHFRLDKEKALEHYSTIRVQWTPWYQERPELTAVVIRPDGTRHELDQTTIEESDVAGRGDMFKSQKALRAPLPQLVVGAVVEREVIRREHQTFFEAGRSDSFSFGSPIAIKSSILTIESPASAPIKWESVGGRFKPKVDQVKEGRHRLVFEVGEMPVVPLTEVDAPSDTHPYPGVAYATTESWEKLGSSYAAYVDQRISGSELSIPKSKAKDRLAIVNDLLKQVHKKVRYTGLELGRAAIIPVAPHVALERGFGDCKDKATLLVALLRRQNIEAHLALIDSYGTTPYKKAAGLEQFDHAIVYVPGPKAMWIDATIVEQPPDYVPLSLQGQVALVARRDGSSLLQLPASASTDNLYRETRRFKMAEFGSGEVSELWEGTGWMEVWLRTRLADRSETKWREILDRYVEGEYGAKQIDELKVERRDIGDARRPSLYLRTKAPRRVNTDDFVASAALNASQLFGWLPESLTQSSEETAARKTPLEIRSPHMVELEFIIETPVGFAVRKLPKTRTDTLGAATIQRSYAVEAGRVKVFYRLNSGPRIWTPTQVDEFRAKYSNYIIGDDIDFEHIGDQLKAQSKFRESLNLYRKIARENSKSGVQAARLASALNTLGLQDEARRVATRSIKTSPREMLTHFILGVVLSSDALGRLGTRPIDRDGAIRAYRKAKEIEPQHDASRRNLAVMLETNQNGDRYGPGADLQSALQEYKDYEKDLGAKDLRVNAMIVLMHLGRFEEVLEMGSDAPASAGRNSLLAAAGLAVGGLTKAREVLADLTLTEEERRLAFVGARANLMLIRRYDLTAKATTAGSSNTPEEMLARANADVIAKVRPSNEVVAEAKGPVKVALRSVELSNLGVIGKKAWNQTASRAFLQELLLEDKISGGAFTEVGHQTFRRMINSANGTLTPPVLADVTVTHLVPKVEGNDKLGYRVTLSTSLGRTRPIVLFVVKEGRRYGIRSSGLYPMTLGAEALSRLQNNDLAGARQWLDWALDMSLPPIFGVFWGGEKPRTKRQAELAAAVLASLSPGTSSSALKVLQKTPWPDDPLLQYYLHFAASHAAVLQPSLRFSHAKKANKLYPLREGGLRVLASAAQTDGERKIAETALRAALSKKPKSNVIRELLALTLGNAGKFQEADKLLTKLIEDSDSKSRPPYNQRAWHALFSEDQSMMLQDALQAARETKFNNIAVLHTLGTVYAMMDQPNQAMGVLQRIFELRDWHLASADFFVLGRIMESYGLAKDAAAMYAKVEEREPNSEIDLAKLSKARLRLVRGKRNL